MVGSTSAKPAPRSSVHITHSRLLLPVLVSYFYHSHSLRSAFRDAAPSAYHFSFLSTRLQAAALQETCASLTHEEGAIKPRFPLLASDTWRARREDDLCYGRIKRVPSPHRPLTFARFDRRSVHSRRNPLL